MAVRLRHLKGFNGGMRGSVRAHPRVPGMIIYVTGSAVVLSYEDVNQPQNILRGHDDAITALAVSASGSLIASGSLGRNADVVIWDTASSSIRYKFSEHDHEVVALAFSPDERLLLSIGHERDPKVLVFDTTTGKIVSKSSIEFNKRVTAIAWAAVAPGNIYTFVCAHEADMTVFTLNPFSGLLAPFKVTIGSVRRVYTSLAFSGDALWLYAGTTSGDIITVNVVRRAIQLTHPVCAGGVGGVMVQAAGKLLVVGGDGSLTMFHHEEMWRDMRPFAQVPGSITSVSSNADGTALILGTAQGAILRLARDTLVAATLEQHHMAAVRGVSFAPGMADCVSTCSDDRTMCIWNLADYSLVTRITDTSAALSIGMTQDAVVTGWADGSIKCHMRNQGNAPPVAWQVASAHAMTHSTGVTAIKVGHRNTFVASGGLGGELRVWDWRSREMVAHLKSHSQAITDLAVLADDAHLIASSNDHMWTLWDLGREACRASWRTAAGLKGLAVAPDQVSVVTVGLDRKLSFWDIRAPKEVRVVEAAHQQEIGAVAMDSRGVTLATGGADNVVKVWDYRSCTPISQIAAHTAPVIKLAYSPGDRQLVSGSMDGAVAIFDL